MKIALFHQRAVAGLVLGALSAAGVISLPLVPRIARSSSHGGSAIPATAARAVVPIQAGVLGTHGSAGVRPRAIVALTAGANDSLALLQDGAVWVWGANGYGQLGTVTAEKCGQAPCSTRPTRVRGLRGITAIAAGATHNLALTSDGAVWAWGDNGSGELGTGVPCQAYGQPGCISTTPVQVRGLRGIVAIAAGSGHSLALTRMGEVWAWGANDTGQLGTLTTEECGPGSPNRTACSTAPVHVGSLGGVVAIGAGANYSVAVRRDGSLWVWGYNYRTPRRVVGLRNVRAIAVGAEHYLVLLRDGAVRAWGANANGQLGNGTRNLLGPSTNFGSLPTPVRGLRAVVAIAAGDDSSSFEGHSLALTRAGTLWAWGIYARLGTGTTDPSSTAPVPVHGLGAVAIMAAGNLHSLVVTQDNTLWAWGANEHGQLGILVATTDVPTLVRVQGVGPIAPRERKGHDR